MSCRRALLPLLISAAPFLRAETEPAIPAARPPARFEQMIQKSPFAPATAVATPTPGPGFAANYYVTGLAKIADKDFVTLAARDGASRFSLAPGEEGPDGIVVTSVQWTDDVVKSKVFLKKGSETGVAEFDQAAAKVAAPVPQPVAPPMPQPGRGWNWRGFNGGQAPNNGVPPPQRTYPQVPNNLQPAVPGASVPAGEGRRRIRIINSRPQ